jgi:predicted RNA-binding Zn ribbon-like protein
MDAVVTVAVQLVNTLMPGEAHGRPYQAPAGDELVAAVSAVLQAGLDRGHGRPGQPRPAVTAAEAAAFGPVALALREVFQAHAAGDEDGAASRVNELLARTGARPELRQHDGEAWHLHFPGRTSALVEGWAAGCATGLAVVLGNGLGWRLGVCSAPRCDRVYVDISRNGTRRFCSTACQNRVKAAAFRAKAGVPAGG